MYNKNNLAVGKVASTSKIKPELSCIAFYGDRTVATDSISLIEMSAEGIRSAEPILLDAEQALKTKLKKDQKIALLDIENFLQVHAGYPEVDRVLEEAEKNDSQSIWVNGKYLADVLLVLAKLHPKQQVELLIPKMPNKPLLLKACTGDKKQRARGLVMPVMS